MQTVTYLYHINRAEEVALEWPAFRKLERNRLQSVGNFVRSTPINWKKVEDYLRSLSTALSELEIGKLRGIFGMAGDV